jgi:hypothetical protein
MGGGEKPAWRSDMGVVEHFYRRMELMRRRQLIGC